MAIIPMIPVGPVTTLNRSILLTERRMSGTGGDDFICGHWGMSCWRTSILQQSAAIPSISAAFARTTMTYHSPPVMVAIGLLDDEAERNQLATTRWSPPTATATGVPPRCKAKMRQGKCRWFSVGDPCATKSARMYLRFCRCQDAVAADLLIVGYPAFPLVGHANSRTQALVADYSREGVQMRRLKPGFHDSPDRVCPC